MALLKVSVALNLLRLSPSRVYSWILWVSIGMFCRGFLKSVTGTELRDLVTNLLGL